MVAVGLNSSRIGAQELPLKRGIPGTDPFTCPALPEAVSPSAEEREEAARLGSSAGQALILGERERARDLLARAIQLDPGAADLAHQYGRILEELGEEDAAVTHYCRMLRLGADGPEAADAASRIEELVAQRTPELPPAAIAAFRSALAAFDAGRLDGAAQAFGRAFDAAPGWTDALYDRGVTLLRLGRRGEALEDLQRYLELEPNAPDAIPVSQRMGQLQSAIDPPSASAALGLGILLPGLGQFYEGREWAGMTVLALAGGAVAAGFLYKEVEIRCFVPPGPDGNCPPGEEQGRDVSRPYVGVGLGAAAAIGVIGAIEAFMNARGRAGPGEGLASFDIGGAQVRGPTLSRGPGGLDLGLARLTF
jgi:tetratricopeptide (TPR) repeat protein